MNPIEMSKEVMAAISYTYELASYSTPELRSLFDDWLSEIEQLLVDFVNTQKKSDPEQISARFNLQPGSVIFILSKLAREGKISMQASGNDVAVRKDKDKGKIQLLRKKQ
ncbi:MAG: hypothetical protein L3J49_12690 [Desulfobulbaceae bacterium]|nr:hypothetical protein [Desulfobulbaceae bacterium]